MPKPPLSPNDSPTLPPQATLAPDQPIRTRAEDRLGRAAFADTIAAAFLGWRGGESLVVALTGSWGSGKSSVKNLVVERLRDADAAHRPDVLEFNPWQWSGADALTSAFFRDVGIALGLGDRGTRDRRVARAWLYYEAVLGVASGAARSVRWSLAFAATLLALGGTALAVALPTDAGPIRATCAYGALAFTVLAALLGWSEKVAGRVAKVLGARGAASERTAEEARGELRDQLAKRDRPLVVVVDDIDRLTTAEVTLLFQLLKLSAGLPNILYFLLYQRDLVEQSLDQSAPGQPTGHGRAYLEKIVQAEFALPPVEGARLDVLLQEGVGEVTADSAFDRHFDHMRWGNLYHGVIRPLVENLRDLRRLLNALRFAGATFRGGGTLEVNPVDLIGVEAVRVFEPDVYNAAARSKELLTGSAARAGLYGREQTDGAKQAILDVIARASDAHRQAMTEWVRQLFPPARWAIDNTYSDGDRRWYAELRVCHPLVFDRYFLFATPSGDVSRSDLDALLAVAHDRAAVRAALIALDERGLLATALDRLRLLGAALPLRDTVPLLTAIYDVGDRLVDADASGHPYLTSWWIARALLEQEPDLEERARLLQQALANTIGLYLPIHHVNAASPRDDEEVKAEAPIRPSLLRAQDWPPLRDLAVRKLEQAAEMGTLLDHPWLGDLLWRWRAIAGNAEGPSQFVTSALAEPSGPLRILRAFAGAVTSQTVGDYVAWRTWQISLKNVQVFIAPEQLAEATRLLDPDCLPDPDGAILRAFRRALEGGTNKAESDVLDEEEDD